MPLETAQSISSYVALINDRHSALPDACELAVNFDDLTLRLLLIAHWLVCCINWLNPPCIGDLDKHTLFVSDRMSAFGQLFHEFGGPLWVECRDGVGSVAGLCKRQLFGVMKARLD